MLKNNFFDIFIPGGLHSFFVTCKDFGEQVNLDLSLNHFSPIVTLGLPRNSVV